MEEFNILNKLEKVKAPPDFEQKVLAQISLRRRQIRARTLRLSLAGAFSAIVVFLLVINFFFFPGKGLVSLTDLEKEQSPLFSRGERLAPSEYIPIIEAVDYQGEVRSVSRDPATIYILEQVSDETSTDIMY
jgi:hypothetical protein